MQEDLECNMKHGEELEQKIVGLEFQLQRSRDECDRLGDVGVFSFYRRKLDLRCAINSIKKKLIIKLNWPSYTQKIIFSKINLPEMTN